MLAAQTNCKFLCRNSEYTHTYTFILHPGVQAALQNISAFCLARRPPGLFFSLARSFVPSSVRLPPLRPERKTSFRHVRDEARELSQRERERTKKDLILCVLRLINEHLFHPRRPRCIEFLALAKPTSSP
jgi:hypothetical protein